MTHFTRDPKDSIVLFTKRLLLYVLPIIFATIEGYETSIYESGRVLDIVRQIYKKYGIDASRFEIGESDAPFLAKDLEFADGYSGDLAMTREFTDFKAIILSPAVRDVIIETYSAQTLSPFIIFNLLHEAQHVLLNHELERSDSPKYQEFQADYQALLLMPTEEIEAVKSYLKAKKARFYEDPLAKPYTLMEEINLSHPSADHIVRIADNIIRQRKRDMQKTWSEWVAGFLELA